MTRIYLELDPESVTRLTALAVAERRPLGLQAEVLLLRALNLWPVPATQPPTEEPHA